MWLCSSSPFDDSSECRRLPLVSCPGHAGGKRNALADRLAGEATCMSSLRLGRSRMLRSLRHYPQAQSQGHHIIDRPEERGVEEGSVKRRERGHIQSDQPRNSVKGNTWEISERRGGAYVGFLVRVEIIFN